MKAKVYNRHEKGMTHKELFREELISIPANDYIVMDYEDAILFKGQYKPPIIKATGEPDPAGFKQLEIIPMLDGEEEHKRYICNFDGKEFPTQTQLDAYIKENHSEKIFKDDSIEEEIIKKRGRPPKEGAHESNTKR